jgi:hypothetical protein
MILFWTGLSSGQASLDPSSHPIVGISEQRMVLKRMKMKIYQR